MRILHTADWHIGKMVHGVYMTQDQKYFFSQLIELIKDRKPDVLIVAGDIYDRSIPPADAVELLDELFYKILEQCDIKIIAITGNHDSSKRLNFASRILMGKGLYIFAELKEDVQPVVIKDEYGEVCFYPIPYAEPAIVRNVYKDEEIKSFDDSARKIIENIKLDEEKRNVCIFHGYLAGGINSESERPLSIGGSENIDYSHFTCFDYTALGHLHRQQRIMNENIRYAGSILKYSFSESANHKSVTMVELGIKGEFDFELIKLKPLHDLRIIEGELTRLLEYDVYSKTKVDDYIMANLTDKGELIDPIGKLRSVYPNILKLERKMIENDTINKENISASEFKQKSMLELFEEFYSIVAIDDLDDNDRLILKDVFDNVLKDRRES